MASRVPDLLDFSNLSDLPDPDDLALTPEEWTTLFQMVENENTVPEQPSPERPKRKEASDEGLVPETDPKRQKLSIKEHGDQKVPEDFPPLPSP